MLVHEYVADDIAVEHAAITDCGQHAAQSLEERILEIGQITSGSRLHVRNQESVGRDMPEQLRDALDPCEPSIRPGFPPGHQSAGK